MSAPRLERILVVEDNTEIRQALRAMLERSYEVFEATDGAGGIEAARRLKPALIISDLMMPGKSGIDVLRAVRGDAETAHIPVMILTAYGELRHKLDGFESGADDYVQKPFNGRELLARIRALLDNRALQRELARKNRELETVLADLKAAQKRLIEAERLRTTLNMAGALAHEILNPLSTILGACDLLRRSLGERPEVLKICDQAQAIADAVRRIQDLREVKFVPYVGKETIVDLAPERKRAVDGAPPSS